MSTDYDATRWRTTRPDRVILAVSRTLTSAIRLLDATALLDDRIRVIYTTDPTSVSPGATSLLDRLGIRVTPWHIAIREEYHAVLTASENVDLTQLRDVPVVVIPHGIGFHKQVPDSTSSGTRLSGLVPAARRDRHRVIHVVSHPAHHLSGVETFLAGDPCHDAMSASSELRPRYREELGVTERLVLVTSTWGERSLFGEDPHLPERLLAELPYDHYRVACALHPAIWAEDGAHEVRRRLRRALHAGLILLAPENGWQQAVVASDVVIGDHGSVTLYAAAHGVPILLGAFGTSEVAPDTALAGFGEVAPRLDHDHDLLPQLAKAETFDITRRLFATTGTWGVRLRGLLHSLLGLPATGEQALPAKALPMPDAEHVAVRSHVVHVEDDELIRFPAAAHSGPAGGSGSTIRFLAVDEEELDLDLRHGAAVFVRSRPIASPEAWLEHALQTHNSAVIAVATESGCLIALRHGRRIMSRDHDVSRAASAVHASHLREQRF